jgi:hypothetical protein
MEDMLRMVIRRETTSLGSTEPLLRAALGAACSSVQQLCCMLPPSPAVGGAVSTAREGEPLDPSRRTSCGDAPLPRGSRIGAYFRMLFRVLAAAATKDGARRLNNPRPRAVQMPIMVLARGAFAGVNNGALA